ncbi:MAG: hypothetical protein AAFP19_05445 [Bacteroidota bacterium]
MARINGVNSDYRYDESQQGVVEVQPRPSPLEMKLFICPYDQPSALEALDGASSACQGTNTQCPQPGATNDGHAMVRLHQNEGVSLVADDDNRIDVQQNGNIQINPANRVRVNGPFEVRQRGGTSVWLNITDTQVRIESGSGAVVVLQSDGDIELRPASGRQVIVRGNMRVTGTIQEGS